jgi:hypothetical protein
MASRITSVTREAPPGEWNMGRWLLLGMEAPLPVTPGTMARAYHGTSMYALHRIVARGLEDGMASIMQGGTERTGVYCHSAERIGLCQHYMLYTSLSGEGFYIAPLIEISFPEHDPKGRKNVVRRKTRSSDQWLTYQDVVHVECVWMHIVHISEMTSGPRSDYIFMEGGFIPQLELDPADSREDLNERSREHKDTIWFTV